MIIRKNVGQDDLPEEELYGNYIPKKYRLTKEEFEQKINEHPLFDIDKETDFANYATERNKLLDLIVNYYQYNVYKNSDSSSASSTVWQVAVDCVKSYHKEKGEFSAYFYKALKGRVKGAENQEKADEVTHGQKLSKKDRMLYRALTEAFRRFQAEEGFDSIEDREFIEFAASRTNIAEAEIRRVIVANKYAGVLRGEQAVYNKRGEEMEGLCLYEMDGRHEDSADDKIEKEAALKDFYAKFNEYYLCQRSDVQRSLSMLMTEYALSSVSPDTVNSVSEMVDGVVVKNEKMIKSYVTEAKETFGEMEFFDERLIEFYVRVGRLPLDKEIAEICGVTPKCISDRKGEFKDWVKKEFSRNIKKD